MNKKDIQKALEEASAVEDKATVDNEKINPRIAILKARKKNLQRRTRQKLPKSLRWRKNKLIKSVTKFVKNALNSTSFGKLAKNVGVLCPSRLK